MRVVYYVTPDGNIRHYHSADSIPADELPARVAEYNKKSQNDHAFIAYLPDGSFEAFLYQQAQARKRLSLDTLRDLRSELAEADSLICDLICQAEEE